MEKRLRSKSPQTGHSLKAESSRIYRELDSIDLGILRILLVNSGVPPGLPVLRKSFRSIAKDLGVDQGTVRMRMKRFRELGVLKGWYLGVSPSLRGHNVCTGWLGVHEEADKGAAASALLSAPEVERVCIYFGPKISLVALLPQGADPDFTLKLLASRVPMGGALHKMGFVQVPPRFLKDTDASIIQVLRDDPWRPFPEVASIVGVSTKTVGRRVAKLSEEGAIYMLPVIDLKALVGAIPIELVVEYVDPASRTKVNESIASHLGKRLIFSNPSAPFGYFAMMVPSLAVMEELSSWVKQQAGVQGARMDALHDVILNHRYYHNGRME